MKIYDDGHADDMTANVLELACDSIGRDVPSFNASVWPDRLRRVADICRVDAEWKRSRVEHRRTMDRIMRILAVFGFATAIASAGINAYAGRYAVMCPYLSLACIWIVVWVQARLH